MTIARSTAITRTRLPFDLTQLSRYLSVVLLCLVTSLVAADDETESESPKAEEPAADIDRTISRLPDALPDGRPIRSIGFFQSQMVELVPDHFGPIATEQLIEGIKNLTPRNDGDSTSRLNSAVYWVDVRDDTLFSRRSEIDIESDSETIVRRALGRVNLAIEQPRNQDPFDGRGSLPRLENRADGELVAVFAGGTEPLSKVQFKWQLRGQPIGTGYSFDLQIPPTPQTRIVFSAPTNLKIESLDGVLRKRSGPPPDGDTLVSGDPKRWFELDAGGLNRVRIRTLRSESTTTEDPWIVRNTSIQYLADATGLQWLCRILVRPPEIGSFPVLQLRNTTVSKISVNSFDVRFDSVVRGARTNIQIDAPESVLRNDDGLSTVIIEGASTFISRVNLFELPMPRWLGNVRVASTVDQVQLVIPDGLQIERWDLPSDWTLQNPQSIDDGSVMHAANGPYPFQRQGADSEQADSNRTLARNNSRVRWSRVRIARPPTVSSAETALRLVVTDDSLMARARMTVNTSPDNLEPFRVRVESDWNVDSLTFVNSGRVVERPRIGSTERIISVWPEPEDLAGGGMAVDIQGSRQIDTETSQLTIPSTWFAAPQNVPHQLIAAIVRPQNLNWSSNALVHPEQIDDSEIPEFAKDFFGDLTRDALVFRPQFGRAPIVGLQMPVASYETTTRFMVLRDRSDLIEQLEVDIESTGQPIQQIVVQTGSSQNRPEYQWSLADLEQSHRIRLPKSAVTIGSGSQDGIYTINLGDQSLRGQRLIGRRSFRFENQQTVALPSVPAATSSRCFAWIGPGLKIDEKPAEVHAILSHPDQGTGNFHIGDGLSFGEVSLQDAIGLRYQPSQSTSITVSESDGDKHVSVVRREQVRIIASSRGVDRIEATYALAPSARPVRIQYEPSLRLVSMFRNDAAVSLQPSERSSVTIPPRSAPEIVRVIWNRDQYENLWIRKCSVPKISISGIVLQSEYQLIPASDAFAPAALLLGLPMSSDQYSAIDLQAGDVVTLIRRNIVLAIGWLLAMLTFAISWLVARRNPLFLACMAIVVVAALFLWWPWKLAIIGWFVVPMIAAGMLATVRVNIVSRKSDRSWVSTHDNSDASKNSADASADFSVQSTVFRLLPWLLFVAGISGTTLVAQEPMATDVEAPSVAQQAQVAGLESIQTSDQPINVLVPVSEDGKRSGSIVYIDRSLLDEIVRPSTYAAPVEASFQSARYRVFINQARVDRVQPERISIEAEYLIHIDGDPDRANEVRIPLAPSSIRRIENLENRSQLVRTRVDGPKSIIASLPRGSAQRPRSSAYRILVTFVPEAKALNDWNQLTLSIPPVAASQLLIESDQNINSLRVRGPAGFLVKKTELRRWTDSIGPQDQLSIEYRVNRPPQQEGLNILKRRYLVNAGQRSVSIDCQIDPPDSMSAGDAYQFIIRDDRNPVLTSRHWKLAQSDLLESSRRKITVTCVQDLPGPIQLNWTLPIETEFSESSGPHSIEIPDVVATGSTQTSDAWIALQLRPGIAIRALDW